MDKKVWQPFTLEDRQYYSWQIGNLQLHFYKEKDEFSLATEQTEEALSPVHTNNKPEEGLEWKRWIICEHFRSLQFFPVMPDRPLVVKTETPLSLLPRCHESFFISIPLWIQIVLNKKYILTELPTVVLSNTWFGSPFDGILAYPVKSPAATSLSSTDIKSNNVVCPLSVQNHSSENFDFVRLCVYTDNLAIFQGATHLWTNNVSVHIEGIQQAARFDVSSAKPQYESIVKTLSKPRQHPAKGLSKKIFSDLKFFKF